MLERLHVDGERFLKALGEESAWFWFLLASAVMSLRFVTEPCNWTSLSRLSRAERGRRARPPDACRVSIWFTVQVNGTLPLT